MESISTELSGSRQNVAGAMGAGPTPPQASFPLGTMELAENSATLHGLAGRSPAMRQLLSRMERMAPHLNLATLEGEEGTGCTLAAIALHAGGPASDGPFVPCAAIEFFGGSAGGESPWSAELLRNSHGGMLFLDRVHQLSAVQQETLSRFVHWFDDRHFCARRNTVITPNGEPSAGTVHLPVQIVFSTSIPLSQTQPSAGFRPELASHLCAVRFRMPPLRERREDIPLLAQIFIQRFARSCGKSVRGLGPGAIAPLLRHSWPGNVRELESVVAAAALGTESQWIRPIDLPHLFSDRRRASLEAGLSGAVNPEAELNLDRAIRGHVNRVLERTKGNKLRAAQLLGISRSTLYRILAGKEDIGSVNSL